MVAEVEKEAGEAFVTNFLQVSLSKLMGFLRFFRRSFNNSTSGPIFLSNDRKTSNGKSFKQVRKFSLANTDRREKSRRKVLQASFESSR